MGSMPYQEEASAGSTTPEATAIAESKPKEENPPATAVEKPMDKTQLDKTEKGIAKNIGKKKHAESHGAGRWGVASKRITLQNYAKQQLEVCLLFKSQKVFKGLNINFNLRW